LGTSQKSWAESVAAVPRRTATPTAIREERERMKGFKIAFR
jgi:hypothetical protein